MAERRGTKADDEDEKEVLLDEGNVEMQKKNKHTHTQTHTHISIRVVYGIVRALCLIVSMSKCVLS